MKVVLTIKTRFPGSSLNEICWHEKNHTHNCNNKRVMTFMITWISLLSQICIFFFGPDWSSILPKNALFTVGVAIRVLWVFNYKYHFTLLLFLTNSKSPSYFMGVKTYSHRRSLIYLWLHEDHIQSFSVIGSSQWKQICGCGHDIITPIVIPTHNTNPSISRPYSKF